MGKTNIQLQAEMAKRKKEAGQKRVGLWLDEKIIERAKLLSGMNQTETLLNSIQIGLKVMTLIKKYEHSLYLNMVDGDISSTEKHIVNCLFSTKTTKPQIIELSE
jgi:hypothetical protein